MRKQANGGIGGTHSNLCVSIDDRMRQINPIVHHTGSHSSCCASVLLWSTAPSPSWGPFCPRVRPSPLACAHLPPACSTHREARTTWHEHMHFMSCNRGGKKGPGPHIGWAHLQHLRLCQLCSVALPREGPATGVSCWLQHPAIDFLSLAISSQHAGCLLYPDRVHVLQAAEAMQQNTCLSLEPFIHAPGWCAARRCCWWGRRSARCRQPHSAW